jgi:para-nitrobenzyl esterase
MGEALRLNFDRRLLLQFLAALAMSFAGPRTAAAQTGQSPVIVTRDNFARAETDFHFAQTVRGGGFGRFLHRRDMVPVNRQGVVRMNRDTLYSAGVFDLAAAPVTITLPDPSRRYMSLQVISEDQYTSLVAYAPGRYAIDEAQAGTRYAMLLVRTLADPRRTDDMAAAHRLQDAIVVEQPHTGMFDVPDWDSASREAVREKLVLLSRQQHIDPSKMFGAKGDVEPLAYLTGAAAGWGGLPRPAAVYESGAVARNDGKTVYRLTVHNVPVDGFWSISVYNRAGYFEKNELEAYSVNNVTATPNADGSVTVQFGGCNRDIANCLPIMPGRSYTVRLYRPRAEVMSGAWSFPKPQPVE